MNSKHEKLVDEILTAALDYSGSARDKLISERCRGDIELEQAVLALLRAAESGADELVRKLDDARGEFLTEIFEEDPEAGEDLSGQVVNSWRLEKRLARGGLATVYIAHRHDGEFDQKAAFKVLRRGLDTDDLIARFRAERQILSTLEHPSIAQILDGGAMDDGRPYLVMEYVDGLPITTYCEQNNIDVRGKSILTIRVLRALHHAHTHLVVHRDVKPSNVLVTPDGNVALLDFGIAKLLDPESIVGASTLTRTGVSLLTPGYGSPEQHAGVAVTTASDIYQVGIVLHEMLTGRRAFDVRLDPENTVALQPSRVLRGQADYKDVRGDLDAIVRKATHGDPGQRYTTADEMISDLQRYLDGRPVAAQPDSLRYRFSKFVKRRPWAFPVLALAILGVAAYVTTITLYTKQLSIEQNRATTSQAFIIDIFGSADPFRPAGAQGKRDVTVVEALDAGVKRLRSEGHNDPALQETLLASIVKVYANLDYHYRAIDLYEELLELQRSLHGNESEPVIITLQALAHQRRTIGDYKIAEALHDEQLVLAQAVYAPSDPKLGIAEATSARMQYSLGNWSLCEQLYENSIDKMRQEPETYAGPLINAMVKLADVRGTRSRAETLGLLDEASALSDRFYGPDSMLSALVQTQTASTLAKFGDYEESESTFLAAINTYESTIGRDHGSTLAALSKLALVFEKTDREQQAEQLHRELLEHYLNKYGVRHRGVAAAYQNLGRVVSLQGRFEEAIPLHRKAMESHQAVLIDDHVTTITPLLFVAYAELSLNRFENAESAAREASDRFRAIGADAALEKSAHCLLDLALDAQGNGGTFAARSRFELIRLIDSEVPKCDTH